ncbi:MAG: hypothetical protein RMK79_10515 [Anaerolineae bacterium]|nr:hypothetical protein [Anaerolineae bacterium]
MTQPTIMMRNRELIIIAGLLTCAILSLILLLSLDALPPVQAQAPDVSASTITQNVSANVNIYNTYSFTGTQTVTITRDVSVSLFNIIVRCSSDFTINAIANLSGSVPVTITYVFSSRTESANLFMSGSGAGSRPIGCPVSGELVRVSISFPVPVSGQITLTTQRYETGAIVQGSGTVSGQATVWVSGSATLVKFAYLPLVARQEAPAGGAWSDDFSGARRPWVNYKCTDANNRLVNCDCDMEYKNGRLRITLNDKNMRCFVGPHPDENVRLREGVFSVEARKRNDNKTWYGLMFNVSNRLHKQRWALEARPHGGSGCPSDEGLVWLSYITDGLGTGKLWSDCTDALKLNRDEWNELTAERRGDIVRVWINDERVELRDREGRRYTEINDGTLKDQPFFNLEVMSEDQTPVVVEFDNFVLQP